jgi:hypothetical protein
LVAEEMAYGGLHLLSPAKERVSGEEEVTVER